MNLAEFSIKNQVLSVIVIIMSLWGGWVAYQDMPRFEDPEFTIRTAVIITYYPGATPLQVAEEITDPLEKALQKLGEVDDIESTSVAGRSEIMVNIKYEFSPTKADLQLIWTKVRNKVNDASRSLPPGASIPYVNDDFGDVYGLYFFLTGTGFTPAELLRHAKTLQSDLLSVDGVAKVQIDGALNEAIFVEISQNNLASLGVSLNQIYSALKTQNAMVSAGDVEVGDLRLVIRPTGGIDSVAAIQNLIIDTTNDGTLIYLHDLAHVWRGYQTPPAKIYKFNGEPAIAIGLSAESGSNIVKIGTDIDNKLQQAALRMPLGMELNQFYNQAQEVKAAVDDFVVNVIAALVIVIITLLIFMGLKSAIVIGSILLLTIAATLATMQIVDIPMHRISLGALIIALGMMVDNAIVVTEGILVGVAKGETKLEIAKKIVTQTKWPLLGGTLVGIIAFAPIGFAPGSTAEYTGHLFWVILISLSYSWLFAVTLTPLFCYWLFAEGSNDGQEDKPEGQFLFRYKRFLRVAISQRALLLAISAGLFAVSIWGFQFVKSGFFPASTSPQMVVDYWLPQGTKIGRSEADIAKVDEFVRAQEGVVYTETSIGAGGMRYLLVYGPQSNNEAYAQILVRTENASQLNDLILKVQNHIDENYPNAQGKVWRFVLGPGGGSKVEAAFSGPDTNVLRLLAEKAKGIMADDGGAISIKDDWRQKVSSIEPIYSEVRGRRAGVTREDLAGAIATNFRGRQVGVYREGNDLIPIVTRAPIDERVGIDSINSIQVLSSVTGKTVPIGQIVDGFKTTWDDGSLKRVDRIWTIKAQSDPEPGALPSDLRDRIKADIEAIELPAGYNFEWKGEYGDSKESNDNLASTIPLGLLAMVLIVVVLFGTLRQPIIIWLVVPLALIGVVVGLVATETPLEFMAILGLLSLSGLLIKNAIVLVDQIDFEISEGKARLDAVVEAAASRVRPVMMGTSTTVLGVLPLLLDAFFKSMAVVIVFGLTFATILTLIIIPILYAVFFKVKSHEVQA